MSNIEALEGIWRFQGYNYMFEITKDKYRVFDLSSISCVEKKFFASLSGSIEEFYELFDRFEFSGNDQITLYMKGGITHYTLDRQFSLPKELI